MRRRDFESFVERKRLGAVLESGADGLDDADLAVWLVEGDVPVFQSKQGEVAAHADICPGVVAGAALAHDDVTGNDGLAAKFFHAEALGIAVASVAGSSLSFFM